MLILTPCKWRNKNKIVFRNGVTYTNLELEFMQKYSLDICNNELEMYTNMVDKGKLLVLIKIEKSSRMTCNYFVHYKM